MGETRVDGPPPRGRDGQRPNKIRTAKRPNKVTNQEPLKEEKRKHKPLRERKYIRS